MQPRGERLGAREELRIRQVRVAVAHGDTAAAAGGAVGEPLPQRARRGGLGPGGGDERGPLRLGEQVDVADPHGRVGDDGTQDRDVPVGERGDGAGVVQVGGVDELEVDVGAGLGDDELEVEVGVFVGHRQHPRGQAGQLERVDGGAPQRQRDLEQRVPGGVAGRVEALDEGLERRVGVGVGGQVPGVDVIEQVGEAGVRVDGRAQHEGAGEHADEVVELRVAAPRHDGADGDVAPRRRAGPAAPPAPRAAP